MATLGKDQIRQILEGRPEGATPEGVIAALREQGHELEGYETKKITDYRLKRQQILAGRAQAEAESSGASAEAMRGLLEVAPQAMGAVGGIAGPVGAAAGGALGRTIVEGAEGLAGEGFNPENIGKEALAQGAGALVGAGVGKALGRVGGTITGRVIRQRAAATKKLYQEAGRQGTRFDPLILTQGFAQLAEDAKIAGTQSHKQFVKLANQFMANKAKPLTPVQIQRIKQVADDIAKPIFEAQRKRIAPPTTAQVQKANFFKMVGDNAREALRTIPGAEKLESATQAAIKQRRLVPTPSEGVSSVGQVAARTGIAGAGPLIGGMVGGFPGAGVGLLAGGLLQNPAVIQALGQGLDNPLIRQLLLQGGRGLGSAFNE